MSKLNSKQEAFAVAVVENGGDKVAAYKAAGYSLNLNANAMGVQADKLFHHPKISLRISELQKVADEVAKKQFSISIEKRLKWLEEIVEAGLSTYLDQAGNQRRENLAASRSAIETINTMLGTGADDENTGERVSVVFNVSSPVGDVKVTKGE